MTKKLFDPEKSFFQLPIVWGTVFLFVIVATILTAIILTNSNLQIDLSYTGFNLWITIHKLPLAILALLIPVIAVLAANHRSEQTKESISLTKSQNRFSNYYKHLEEFIKYTTKLEEKHSGLKINARKLHGHLFQNSRTGNYLIPEETLINLKKELQKAVTLLSKISKSPNEISTEIIDGVKNINISSISKNAATYNKPGPQFQRHDRETQDRLAEYRKDQNESIREILLHKLSHLQQFDEILLFETEQYVNKNNSELISEAIRISAKISVGRNLTDHNNYTNPASFPTDEIKNVENLYNQAFNT